MKLKGKLVAEPTNTDPSVLIGLVLIRTNEDQPVDFILPKRLSECVNGYERVSPRLLWFRGKVVKSVLEDEGKKVRGVNKRTNISKKNNEWWNFKARKIASEKKKTWLDLPSAKANHRVPRKDILKDKLKNAKSTYKDAKMRAKECVKRRKNEIKKTL
ncbi:hypothetical protein EVAR_40981_1 [Eumeta japonica]|uniref:Uncharacterized protein n=1 Tax=Eumeta variegata TaxID=151549 RepID=A0A4C1XFL3_EUMVA|nr:hypothetical protein EVAR_40981_1 [Eumeta japonica]